MRCEGRSAPETPTASWGPLTGGTPSRPIGGLVWDLTRRGLLDEAPVVFATPFGRTRRVAGFGRPRPPHLRHQRVVKLIREIPQKLHGLTTPMAIPRLARTDPSPAVRAAAQECSRVLRQRAHERGERRAQLRDLQWDATQDAAAKAAAEREAAG